MPLVQLDKLPTTCTIINSACTCVMSVLQVDHSSSIGKQSRLCQRRATGQEGGGQASKLKWYLLVNAVGSCRALFARQKMSSVILCWECWQ